MKHILKNTSILLISTLILTGVLLLSNPAETNAVTASDWRPGRIIDDAIFIDKDSMSVAQIQQFLNSKVPVCDIDGSEPISSGSNTTRAQWAAANGKPAPPYTCLKDYYEVPKEQPGPGIPANNYGHADPLNPANIPAGSKSAAHIISDAARAYNINPKVLLVTIQKESYGPLTTDDWPYRWFYTYAMGAHCPDSGPNGQPICDENYAGFSMQIRESARLFRAYLDGMDQAWWGCTEAGVKVQCSANRQGGSGPGESYKVPYATNFILWNVKSTGCGGSNIYIENKATAALYYYTPYQPNQAALLNMNGTGDGCSAYGNRNFWRIFNDWFTTTYAVNSSWGYVSQEMFADSARTKPINPSFMSPNTTYYLRLSAKNSGPAPWTSGKVNLATPGDHNSVFCDSSWLTCNRAATLKQASVAPGNIGTFEFSVRTPSTLGNYKQYFRPVVEGVTWMNDIGMHWSFQVKPPTPNWNLSGQAAYVDAGRTKPLDPTILAPNTTYYVRVQALNSGNTTWQNSGGNPVNLATDVPADHNSVFCDSSWLTCNRAATLKQASVAPGNIGTFEFSVRTPSTLGNYKQYFRPVVEGVTWMNDIGMHIPLFVKPPTYTWQYLSQGVYTDASKTVSVNTASIPGGTRVYNVVRVRNTGNVAWLNTGPNPIRLATSNPPDRVSTFCDSSWLSCNRAATIKEASVAPGDVGTFEFWSQVPYAINGTTFKEYFRLVAESKQWLSDIGLHFPYKTNSPEYSYSYVGQGAFSDPTRALATSLSTATPSQTYYLRVRLKNTSGTAWQKTGSNPIRLATSNPPDRVSTFCDSSWLSCNRAATIKEASVAPGDVGTFEFSIRTTPPSGSYAEYFRPVVENKQWLADIGLHFQITY